MSETVEIQTKYPILRITASDLDDVFISRIKMEQRIVDNEVQFLLSTYTKPFRFVQGPDGQTYISTFPAAV